jgi:hypothetical protein
MIGLIAMKGKDLLVLFLCLSSVVFGQVSDALIKIEAIYDDKRYEKTPPKAEDGVGGYGRHKLATYLIITNIGRHPVIVLKNSEPPIVGVASNFGKTSSISVLYAVHPVNTILGEWRVPSMTGVNPIELAPGEKTELRALVRVDDLSFSKLIVSYNVDAKVAAKFGAWSGSLKVNALKLAEAVNAKRSGASKP